MGVIQTDIFGDSYEIVAGKAYKISKEEITQRPKYQPQHFAGGRCRPCNYAENSDEMFGDHCGECDCCFETLSN